MLMVYRARQVGTYNVTTGACHQKEYIHIYNYTRMRVHGASRTFDEGLVGPI